MHKLSMFSAVVCCMMSVDHVEAQQRQRPQQQQNRFQEPARTATQRDDGWWRPAYPADRPWRVRRSLKLSDERRVAQDADQPLEGRDRVRVQAWPAQRDRWQVPPEAAAWNEGYGNWAGAGERLPDRVRVGRDGAARPVTYRAAYREEDFRPERARVRLGSAQRPAAQRERDQRPRDTYRLMGTDERRATEPMQSRTPAQRDRTQQRTEQRTRAEERTRTEQRTPTRPRSVQIREFDLRFGEGVTRPNTRPRD